MTLQLGIRDRLGAAKELLDRVGLIKTEKVQVEASGGVMILPPKKNSYEKKIKKVTFIKILRKNKSYLKSMEL